MNRPRYGLTFWLRCSYAVAVIVTAVALGVLINRQVTSVLEAEVRGRLQSHARVLAERFDDSLNERLADMRLLSQLPIFRSGAPPRADAHRLFDRLATHEPDYAWIGFADPRGRVVAASKGLLEGGTVAARPWFQAARHGPFLGGTHEAVLLAKHLPPEPNGQPLRFIDVAAPVHDAQGRLVGVVGGHLSVHWANELERKLQQQAADLEDAEVLVIDHAGLVLVGPDGIKGTTVARDARTGRVDMRSIPALARPGLDLLAGQAATASLESGRGLGWTVLVHTSRRDALASAHALQATIAVGTGALALLAAALAAWLARHITAPLERLAAAATRMRHDRELALPSNAGYAEAHDLYTALHGLLADLRTRESELVAMAGSLEATVAERTQALQNANAELERLSVTDALTGLSNRRRFEDALRAESERARRQRIPLALIVVDIDHFKRINDTHGHPVGDRVLVEVAARLAQCVRPTDVLARIGGEEFAVLAPGADAGQAAAIAERMRCAVSDHGPLRIGRIDVAVTLSGGVGVMAADVDTDTDTDVDRSTGVLYRRVDAALYDAKCAGRNRIARAAGRSAA